MTTIRDLAATAQQQGYTLTPFGQLLLTYDPDWQACAVAHLMQPCDQPTPCELHQQWAAHQAASRPPRRVPTTAERIEKVSARLEANRARLAKACAELERFYRANVTSADPAIVNHPVRRRPGAMTERKVAMHGRLQARVTDLRARITRDEDRLRRLRCAP